MKKKSKNLKSLVKTLSLPRSELSMFTDET